MRCKCQGSLLSIFLIGEIGKANFSGGDEWLEAGLERGPVVGSVKAQAGKGERGMERGVSLLN